MIFDDETEQRLAEYREAAVESAAIATSNPKESNRWTKRGIVCYGKLRGTDEGREGIIALMHDANPHVRVLAAVHSLQWRPEEARTVLETLRDGEGPGAFEAKWALIRFEEGTLPLDY